jgi:hypothetical protein
MRALARSLQLAAPLYLFPATGNAQASLFFPSEEQRLVAEERELADRIEGSITALSGSAGAHVLVSLPRPAQIALDQALPAARIRVELAQSATRVRDEQLAEIVDAAGLGPRRALQVVRHTESAGDVDDVGKMTVLLPPDEKIRTHERVALIASLIANVILATAVLLRMPQRPTRRVRRSNVS